MPRYFFDTFDGERLVPDEARLEMQDFAAARAAAQKALPDMARDAFPDGNHRSFVVSVRDEAGGVVLRATLSLVVEEGTLDRERHSEAGTKKRLPKEALSRDL